MRNRRSPPRSGLLKKELRKNKRPVSANKRALARIEERKLIHVYSDLRKAGLNKTQISQLTSELRKMHLLIILNPHNFGAANTAKLVRGLGSTEKALEFFKALSGHSEVPTKVATICGVDKLIDFVNGCPSPEIAGNFFGLLGKGHDWKADHFITYSGNGANAGINAGAIVSKLRVENVVRQIMKCNDATELSKLVNGWKQSLSL
ncbi:MAG: hypothetical protein Q7S21_03175 [archaeon]|nr:hypothetical protein [archaeon]